MSRRRRVTVAVVTAAAVVVTASAAATIVYERANDRSKVHCYPIWTKDFDNQALGGDAMQVDADSPAIALQICSSLWQQGYIVSTPPYLGDGTQKSDPRLIACVLPGSVVGVFPPTDEPGQQTCQDLGLAVSEG